jgi:hypothetical protein
MNNDQITSIVESRLKEGATREEIFREVGGTDDAARIIAATPDFESRQKYAKMNWILAGIIAYFAIFKFVTSTSTYLLESVPFYIFPTVLIIPIASIYFITQILKFRGVFYLIVGLFCIGVGLNHGRDLDSVVVGSHEITAWTCIYGPMVVGALIAFYLKKKLCPDLGYLGAKTDKTGKYQFLKD